MSAGVFEKIYNSVLEFNEEKTLNNIQNALDKGLDPLQILEKGLIKAVTTIGEKWEKEEAFLTEVMIAADIVKKGREILDPEIKKKGVKAKKIGKVLMGTVEGDIHDIGKNIVATMLEIAGFEIFDLGTDVPTGKFVEKVKELKPSILGMSAMLTTTMPKMKEVIEALEKKGLRENVKVLIGGAPVSAEWAEQIGADGYGEDASEAVKVAKKLVA